ncbi:MAG: response regulator transcription factor [Planctomycetes bacterium]|nr:response regulator transcription factor [Planctomycetota bacterium]
MIRVFVADDQALVRSGLCSLLALAPGLEVAGDAGDGAAALAALAALAQAGRPVDVLLLDVRMPGLSGLDVLRRLGGAGPRVVVLTTFPDDDVLLEALRLGAAGFLLKDATFEELVEAIEAVARGESAVRPVTLSKILPGLRASGAAAPPIPPPPATLTAREKEVLRLLAAGLSNKEIARALDNAEGTIKNHVSSILAKLGVRDRTQAVLLGIQLGLV